MENKLEKLKKLADAMYYAAQYLTTDASRLHKAMDEYHKFIIHECKKEPVSEKKCTFTKDSFTNEDRKVLCDGCEEECKYAQKEEPVSEELEEAADEYAPDFSNSIASKAAVNAVRDAFKAGAKWKVENLWKPADGDDLPIFNREVIALLDNGKVVFAHRPPEFWDGKDIVTGKVTRNYVERYDKGLWNIPNVKYWLDVELPKEIEL